MSRFVAVIPAAIVLIVAVSMGIGAALLGYPAWAPRRHTMLIDINPVAPTALRSQRRGFVGIGAMTRWRDLEDSAEIAQISR